MKPRIKKDMPQHTPRKREGMDPRHLENVRGLGCVGCGVAISAAPYSSAIHAHHLLRTEERGLSRKSSDRWAVPLCSICHDKLHRDGNEERWLAGRGIDGRAVASALWAARGELEAMRRVIFRARQDAALKMRANA